MRRSLVWCARCWDDKMKKGRRRSCVSRLWRIVRQQQQSQPLSVETPATLPLPQPQLLHLQLLQPQPLFPIPQLRSSTIRIIHRQLLLLFHIVVTSL